MEKSIYPYEYMDSFRRFGKNKLPGKEKCYSSLSAKAAQMRSMHTRKRSGRHLGAKIVKITVLVRGHRYIESEE